MKYTARYKTISALSSFTRLIAGLVIIVSISSCGQKTESKKEIETKIKEYKTEVIELNKKIEELQKQVNAANPHTALQEPVTIEALKTQEFNHYFKVSGTLEAVKQAIISPETSGRIIKIQVQEGDQVKKGQVIAKLDDAVIQNTIAEVKSSLKLAKTVFDRQNRLWKKKIGSEIQFLEAKTQKEGLEQKLKTLNAQLNMTIVRSPLNGVIEKLYQKTGEFGSPAAPLAQVVNLSSFYLKADIPENYLPVIKRGTDVEINFPSFPGIDLKETIKRVGNVVDPNNRSFEIELEFKNPDNKLKANIIGEIKINDFSDKNSIVVPTKIIRNDPNGAFLYTAKATDNKTIAQKTYIETGLSDGIHTLINSGLKQGDMIIIDGYANVSNGSNIKIISKQ
ncbi:MAG: efflux RND transporter periplasmic adaptor subunit [Bacteroidales bacterium]